MYNSYFENNQVVFSDEEIIMGNPRGISFVEQTDKNCMYAVSLDHIALKYIPKALHTYELCSVAVSQCGYALKHVSKKIINEELCYEAVKTGHIPHGIFEYNVFDLIPPKYLTQEFFAKAYEINPKIVRGIPSEFRKKTGYK